MSNKKAIQRLEARPSKKEIQAIKLLDKRDIKEIMQIQDNAFYTMIKTDDFPKPIRVTPKSARWKYVEIKEWLEKRKFAYE